jgi:hypothetical protein
MVGTNPAGNVHPASNHILPLGHGRLHQGSVAGLGGDIDRPTSEVGVPDSVAPCGASLAERYIVLAVT